MRGAAKNILHTVQIGNSKNNQYALRLVGISVKIPIKCIQNCNVIKHKEIQGLLIVLQGTIHYYCVGSFDSISRFILKWGNNSSDSLLPPMARYSNYVLVLTSLDISIRLLVSCFSPDHRVYTTNSDQRRLSKPEWETKAKGVSLSFSLSFYPSIAFSFLSARLQTAQASRLLGEVLPASARPYPLYLSFLDRLTVLS